MTKMNLDICKKCGYYHTSDSKWPSWTVCSLKYMMSSSASTYKLPSSTISTNKIQTSKLSSSSVSTKLNAKPKPEHIHPDCPYRLEHILENDK